MKHIPLFLLVFMGSVTFVQADIFEYGRPTDSALREALLHDRQSGYMQTPGVDHQENEERISDVKALGVDMPIGPRGLRDLDKAHDMYLREQLQKDRDYKNAVALNHPLVLLEYASPVLADVVKHYRMSSYERLAIEQVRLSEINQASEGLKERLSRQSDRECLQRNESKGLVAAMRLCQNGAKPLAYLRSIDGGGSLEDGRRRIHIVRESLTRLGFEKARIDKIIDLTGDKMISNDRYEERLPKSTFERKAASARQVLVRKWREVFERFRETGRVGAESLEGLSLPGVPVTARVLADLDLLEAHERESFIFKFASGQAFFQTQRLYRQIAGYLDLCRMDPVLDESFRGIIEEKRDSLLGVLAAAQKDRAGDGMHKDLVAAVADTADMARARLHGEAGRVQAAVTPSLHRGIMLNF